GGESWGKYFVENPYFSRLYSVFVQHAFSRFHLQKIFEKRKRHFVREITRFLRAPKKHVFFDAQQKGKVERVRTSGATIARFKHRLVCREKKSYQQSVQDL